MRPCTTRSKSFCKTHFKDDDSLCKEWVRLALQKWNKTAELADFIDNHSRPQPITCGRCAQQVPRVDIKAHNVICSARNCVLNWNKHKGSRLQDILEIDKSYVEWLARQPYNATYARHASVLLNV